MSELTLPKRWFARTPSLPAGNRIYAIGDVHGRFDLFWELIDRIDENERTLDRAHTRIIVLGDFIDRGPGSRDMMATLRAAGTRYPNFIILIGNHEAALLETLRGDEGVRDDWLSFGGLETLASLGVAPPHPGEDRFAFVARLADAIGEETVEWLGNLSTSFRLGDFYFCHAGVRPGVPLQRQRREDLLWIRDDFLLSEANHGAVIVHGHSISDDVTVRSNRIGIDTGAYESGVLSSIGIEQSRIWKLSTAA